MPAGLVAPPLDYPEVNLGQLLLDQARRTPGAEAVTQWDSSLTYHQLISDASALAAELVARGIGPEDRVGICTERTPAMVVAAVGVLLSGAGWVPLEAGGPRRRLEGIAQDAALTVVVGDDTAARFCAGTGAVHVPVPQHTAPVDLAAVTAGPALPDHVAYVLFTSGSTGRPKGVLNTHRNLVEFVTNFAGPTGADADTRSLGFASLGFDLVTVDLFVPLTRGGCVQLAGAEDRNDPVRLERFMARHRVNWGVFTPAVLALLDPAAVPDYRTVLCGGEPVPGELVEAWTRPGDGRRFINVYGPTETSVAVTVAELSGPQDSPPPIGRPLANHRAYLVDETGAPVPPGETGELLIGGPGVARGYLNRPSLTAERFVPDPFSGTAGERLYRTGDIARVREDGQIVYVGRADGQLKVRGQRVEIGEVEVTLQDHPQVQHAVVVSYDGPQGAELAAYLTPATAPRRAELLDWAAERLTGAMIPARVVPLETLPRNASEKADRAQLAEHARQSFGQPEARVVVGDDPAGQVGAAWAQVLGRVPATDDDFFDVGGNSIAAMRLVALLRKGLSRDLTVEDVFAGRTPRGIADRAGNAPVLHGPEIVTGNPPTLSSPQQRLWFLDRLAPDAAPYNIAFAERVSGPLDLAALGAGLTALTRRHDILRWRVREQDGAPVAGVEPVTAVTPEVTDLSEDAVAADLAAFAARPLDLGDGPTWRCRVLRLGPTEHVLAFVLHHAVFDGWSQAVFYDDLAEAYRRARTGAEPELPATAAGYGDYAVWRADRDRTTGAADLAWWAEELAGAPTVLDLPRDRPRPAVATYRGAQVSEQFPETADRTVRELATALGTTPTSVVLAGFGELVRRVTGTQDRVLGAVVADRRLAEFDPLVGFFVDMLPVRLRDDAADTVAGRVVAAGSALMEATGHPGAPIERIVTVLGRSGRDLSRAPLVQVMFNVINYAEPRLRLPDLVCTPVEVAKPGSPFDLTVYLVERGGRLGLELLYNPDLFDADRMQALARETIGLTAALSTAADQPLAQVAPHLPGARVREADPAAMTTLPRPEQTGAAESPQRMTPTEQAVHAVWCEVLGRPGVAVTDNFFDVGGHSMALVEVHSKLAARLGPTELSMVSLFHHPNIRALAAHLDGAQGGQELDRAAARAAARRHRISRRRTARPARPNQGDTA